MRQNISSKDILKFIGMVLATGVGGLVVGLGIGYLVGWFFWNRIDFGGLIGLVVGIVLAYPLGVFLGLVVVKGFWRARGSILLGLGGIIAAEFLTVGVPYLTHFSTPALTVLFLVVTPFLGTAGFYLGRRISK